jgi:hypothetical protein
MLSKFSNAKNNNKTKSTFSGETFLKTLRCDFVFISNYLQTSKQRLHQSDFVLECDAFAMRLWCVCDAFAIHLRCICDAFAMRLRCICDAFAMHLRCVCNAFAMRLRCVCNGFEMGLRCICDAFAMLTFPKRTSSQVNRNLFVQRGAIHFPILYIHTYICWKMSAQQVNSSTFQFDLNFLLILRIIWIAS